MSNLGWYQLMTTFAKKVGGPKRFMSMLFGGGALTGGTLVWGGSKIKKIICKELKKKEDARKAAIIYTVDKNAKSKEGLAFVAGDRFKILEKIDDAALIEKLGDNNNPYFVSCKFLASISDYLNE